MTSIEQFSIVKDLKNNFCQFDYIQPRFNNVQSQSDVRACKNLSKDHENFISEPVMSNAFHTDFNAT